MNYFAPKGSRYYEKWQLVAPRKGNTRIIMVEGIYEGEYAGLWVFYEKGKYSAGAHLHRPTGNPYYPDTHRTVKTRKFATEIEAVKAIERKVDEFLYKEVPGWAMEALESGWKAPKRVYTSKW